MKFSQAIEDYLKQIYLLEEQGEPASGSELARRLDVSAASVTGMLKRLVSLELVAQEPYQGATLTKTGRAIALEVVRHHRLLEAYLAEVVGMSWSEVHAEAEILEHYISERFEALIDERLGHPQRDPHGHPIPAMDGTLPTPAERIVSLDFAELDEPVEIDRVGDERPDVLEYLGQRGLMPGAPISIIERQDIAGTVTVRVGNDQYTLGRELAASILVRPAQLTSKKASKATL